MSLSERLSNLRRLAARSLFLTATSIVGILWVNSQGLEGISEANAAEEIPVTIDEFISSSKIRMEFHTDEPMNFCPQYCADLKEGWIPLNDFEHHYSDGLNVCYVEIPDPVPPSVMVRIIPLEEASRPTIFPQHPTVCPARRTTCPASVTQCVQKPTHCPVKPSVTQCPRLPTQCAAQLTRCPERPTHCPVRVTTCAKKAHPTCLLYTSPSPRDGLLSRMPSSA